MAHDCYNGFTKEWVRGLPTSPTLKDLRSGGGRYRIISDGQLKRDLKGPPTLQEIYRANAAGRRYDKREIKVGEDAKSAYLAWCEKRGHTPHPASLDPEHPIAQQRESVRHVKRA